MLIIPITDKTGWHNPPYLTILLILTNCLVFFLLQGNEAGQLQRVVDFYRTSHLAAIEAPLYEKYLQATGDNEKLQKFKTARRIYGPEAIYWKISGNQEFHRKLINNEIITPDQKIYTSWRGKRDRLKSLLNAVVSFRYGHIPSRFSFITPFTYMFLHGGIMHLVGNMVFLWLLGSILEISCNRAAYLGGYLLTGYFSALFFAMIYHNSSIPLVGASGAIAGLMGAFTVIYGRGKVKVFYSLGFYFSYARVYALLLLPFWIGRELFQIFFSGPSNVAFAGHIGGLLSGASLGLLQLKLCGAVQEEETDAGGEDKTAAQLEEGMARMAELDHGGARPIFTGILAKDSKNLAALEQLYKIDKNKPHSTEFPKTASRLLTRLCRRKADFDQLLQVYREYCDLRGAALSRELYTNLAQIFVGHGQLTETARIVNFLLQKQPQSPGLPGLLLSLARAFKENEQGEKGNNCLRILLSRYPDSQEARMAETEERA